MQMCCAYWAYRCMLKYKSASHLYDTGYVCGTLLTDIHLKTRQRQILPTLLRIYCLFAWLHGFTRAAIADENGRLLRQKQNIFCGNTSSIKHLLLVTIFLLEKHIGLYHTNTNRVAIIQLLFYHRGHSIIYH